MPGPTDAAGNAPLPADPRRLVVAITGATGAIYGIRLLQVLRQTPGIETHLMLSEAGVLNLHQELDMNRKDAEAFADVVHNVRDIGASIASGSFQSDGMIVAPCSMKTLAAIAHGLSDNLISRAADVVLKERRRLVLMVRETPLHAGHLKNMLAVTEMGGVIAPPVPALYAGPKNLQDVIDHNLGRALDLFGIHLDGVKRWGEDGSKPRGRKK